MDFSLGCPKVGKMGLKNFHKRIYYIITLRKRMSPSQSFSRPPSGALWTPKKSKPGFNLLVYDNVWVYVDNGFT